MGTESARNGAPARNGASTRHGMPGWTRPSGRRTTVAGWFAVLAAIGMVVAAAFHVIWAFSPWPLETWWEWNRTVTGTDDATARTGLGWAVNCFVIVGLLLAAACIVATRAGVLPRVGPWWAFRIAAWCVVLVLLGRGVLGLVVTVPEDLPFHHWNLVLYSPLCLVLAALSAGAIACAGRSPGRGRGR